jgi:hypothetical protein
MDLYRSHDAYVLDVLNTDCHAIFQPKVLYFRMSRKSLGQQIKARILQMGIVHYRAIFPAEQPGAGRPREVHSTVRALKSGTIALAAMKH